jgi:hypothetical protein
LLERFLALKYADIMLTLMKQLLISFHKFVKSKLKKKLFNGCHSSKLLIVLFAIFLNYFAVKNKSNYNKLNFEGFKSFKLLIFLKYRLRLYIKSVNNIVV